MRIFFVSIIFSRSCLHIQSADLAMILRVSTLNEYFVVERDWNIV